MTRAEVKVGIEVETTVFLDVGAEVNYDLR